MPQVLLFPDPRPLVERLGPQFFQQAPDCPGVYLMRDAADAVLYVGKARNLRKRLANYRVATPARLPRRQLRLLRAVTRIELEECGTEASALARESELLRNLRPRFNRAGTWPGPRRFVTWRVIDCGLELAVAPAVEPGWLSHGPMGAGVFPLRTTLLRLCWCALHPQRGLAAMPEGWFHGRCPETVAIPASVAAQAVVEELATLLQTLFAGNAEPFTGWIRERMAGQTHPFEVASRDEDLETLGEFAEQVAVR